MRLVEDADSPWGSSGSLCPGRPSPPQSPRALPGIGGQPGDRTRCGREVGKGGGHLASLKRPPGPGLAPPPPAGGRMMEAAAAWWRAGVQGGHEGHAQIPECACVRA